MEILWAIWDPLAHSRARFWEHLGGHGATSGALRIPGRHRGGFTQTSIGPHGAPATAGTPSRTFHICQIIQISLNMQGKGVALGLEVFSILASHTLELRRARRISNSHKQMLSFLARMMTGDDIMPGYGIVRGGDFGKGHNGMKGGDFGKGPYWGGEAKGATTSICNSTVMLNLWREHDFLGKAVWQICQICATCTNIVEFVSFSNI